MSKTAMQIIDNQKTKSQNKINAHLAIIFSGFSIATDPIPCKAVTDSS